MKFEFNDRKLMHDGFIKIDDVDVTYERFNGGGITASREIMERDDGVAVLLY